MTRFLFFLLLFHAASTGVAVGQSLNEEVDARLLSVRLEPEEPVFGERFDAHLVVRLRSGLALSVSDTVFPSEGIQSLTGGSWTLAAAPGDSVDLSAHFPLIGLREGRAEMPRVPLWAVPAAAGSAAPTEIALRGEADGVDGEPPRFVIHLGSLLLAPHPALSAEGAGRSPKPPGDVLGGEWSIWLLFAVGLASVAGAGGVGSLATRWWSAVGSRLFARSRGRSPRQEALRELERIRATGWHRNGRIEDFYASSTDAVRHFAARVDPAWGIFLTSGELLGRLEERIGRAAVGRLAPAVEQAERVKFGAQQPDGEAAERDWETLRDWVRDTKLG